MLRRFLSIPVKVIATTVTYGAPSLKRLACSAPRRRSKRGSGRVRVDYPSIFAIVGAANEIPNKTVRLAYKLALGGLLGCK
jgi:hypothetical protein